MISIEPLRSIERAEWQPLFVGYNAFYGRELPDAAYDRAWAAFQQDDRMHGLAATLEGRVVGIAHYLTHVSTTSADVCYLQDLFTDPATRGQGVARTLIEAVTEAARAQNCSRVYWSTHETNTTARRLYDRVAVNRGFILYQITL